MDQAHEALDHAADPVLDLVELAVEHEGGRAHQLVLRVHAHLIHVLEQISHFQKTAA